MIRILADYNKLIKISTLLLCIFFALSCTIKKISVPKKDYLTNQNIPKIDRDFETFSDEEFLHSKARDIEIQNDDNTVVKTYMRTPFTGEIIVYDYTKNLIFGTYKEFYSNGKIKLKGIYCWYGFKIGDWISYNSLGEISNTTNYDDGFSFGSKDILKYCLGHNISLDRQLDHRTYIFKDNRFPQKWEIHYEGVEKRVKYIISLNARDGKLIKKETTLTPSE